MFLSKMFICVVAKYLKDLVQLSLGDFTTLMNSWPERTSLPCTSIFYFTLVVSSRCNPIISRIRRLNNAHSPSFSPVCCPRVNVYSDTCTSTTSEAGRTHFKASRHAVTKWRKRNEIYIGTVCYQGSSSFCALIVVKLSFRGARNFRNATRFWANHNFKYDGKAIHINTMLIQPHNAIQATLRRRHKVS